MFESLVEKMLETNGVNLVESLIVVEILDENNEKFKCKVSDFDEKKNKIIKMKLNFITMMSASCDEHVSFVLLILKERFVFLKCLSLRRNEISSRVLNNFIKLIQENTPKLEFLKFLPTAFTQEFVLTLHFMMKEKYNKGKPLNLQLIRLYDTEIPATFPIQRVGYILSKLAVHCKRLFHVQFNPETNEKLMKFFLIAADFASRKKVKGFVSTGGYFKHPTNLSDEYKQIWKYANLKNNPHSWNQDVTEKVSFYEAINDSDFMN